MTEEAKSSVGGRAKLWHSPWELLINKEGFPYPENYYANGAWLKEINIETSRVHDPLYMMICCELSITTLQCRDELSTLAFSSFSAPPTDKLPILKNSKPIWVSVLRTFQRTKDKKRK